jgi:purine nucleosidase
VRLVIDTDAGVDDAQAIMMALTHPGVNVEAITTVAGNTAVAQVTANVFTILDLMKKEVPVFQGADCPLLPEHWYPEHSIHGEDGLGNLPNRPPTKRQPQNESAAVALVRLANRAPGQLTLVALGPLTNIALACRLDCTLASKIKRFVFMGGATTAFGNARLVTSEFNIFTDPEAAHIVLTSFPDSTMLSWETTVQHPLSWEQYDQLITIKSAAARFFKQTNALMVEFLKSIPLARGFLLPDPLAMAAALNPGVIVQSEKYYVAVELHGQLSRGQTVVDFLSLLGKAPNVQVISRVDMDRVFEMYQRMLA